MLTRDVYRSPLALVAGSRVALIAPAGPLRDESELQVSIENSKSLGWQPRIGKSALVRDGYFAGADALRLQDLLDALNDPDIDGIWCLRGGYGAARLLPHVPMDLVSRRAMPLIGYSDITALHALWQHAGVQSFHAPTAREQLTDFSRQSFVRFIVGSREQSFTLHALLGSTDRGNDESILHGTGSSDKESTLHGTDSSARSYSSLPQTLIAGRAQGHLAGGNLAVLTSLCGTPWAMNFTNAIVVLEDINESAYRIDRMLLQLRLSGAFRHCAGFLFGQFSECPNDSKDESDDDAVMKVLRECAEEFGVPAVAGAPVGHVDNQWTLPLDARATLDSAECSLTFERT